MSSRRTRIIRPAMLLVLLIGFLAMDGMSATTPGAGHHGATTLASPHTHHVAAANSAFHTAIGDRIATIEAGTLIEHIAEPASGADESAVTTGCVVALAGFLGLLAFLAQLRSRRPRRSHRSLPEHLRDAVGQRNMRPPPHPRLHISLCVLRV
jgi:hypothetical protein